MHGALFPALSRRKCNQLLQEISSIWTYLICEEKLRQKENQFVCMWFSFKL